MDVSQYDVYIFSHDILLGISIKDVMSTLINCLSLAQ